MKHDEVIFDQSVQSLRRSTDCLQQLVDSQINNHSLPESLPTTIDTSASTIQLFALALLLAVPIIYFLVLGGI